MQTPEQMALSFTGKCDPSWLGTSCDAHGSSPLGGARTCLHVLHLSELIRARDAELRAEVERLRAGIEALHRPVHPVFSWNGGLRFEEPCPECHGKAGVHPCGCWADEDTQYECLECAQPKGDGARRVVPWPCSTAALLTPTEGETDA